MKEKEVKLISIEQAKKYYNLSRPTVVKLAEEKNALIRIGRAMRIDVQKLDVALETV